MSAIKMSGTGKIRTRPDLALIGVSVETQHKKSSEARHENNDTMEKLITAVRLMKIDQKDIQTAGYRLRETVKYIPKGRRKGESIRTGYSVQNTLIIKLRDLDKVDDLLDGLADAGATAIVGPNFTVENPAGIRDKARKLAFERAKGKAEIYCELAGMKIVGLLNLDEDQRHEQSYDRRTSASARSAAYAAQLADESERGDHIAVGEEEVEVTVNCDFEIAPRGKKVSTSSRTRRTR